MRRLAFAALIIFTLACIASAQDKNKRPSPPASAHCAFADGKTIHVDYSSPRMKDPKTGKTRKIFGGLVPYDKEWRTGANEATTFVTTADVTVDGTTVPAGSYTLFTVPSEGTWKLIISKKTGEWGIPYPGEKDDLARVDMKKETLSKPVENFTISFDKTGPKSCRMKLEWETTRAYVDMSEK